MNYSKQLQSTNNQQTVSVMTFLYYNTPNRTKGRRGGDFTPGADLSSPGGIVIFFIEADIGYKFIDLKRQ